MPYKNIENRRICSRRWKENNPEYYKEYRKNNKDKRNEQSRQWHINHREQEIQRIKQWRESNPQHCLKYQRQYYKTHPKIVREIGRRHENKRKRNLGFNILNEFFKDSEAHHINNNDVIYIPKEIHQNIRHCLETGRNMLEINKIAMNYI